MEEARADRLHVEVQQGGGEGGAAEQGRLVLLRLDLQVVQSLQEFGFLLLEPEERVGGGRVTSGCGPRSGNGRGETKQVKEARSNVRLWG